MEARSEPKQTNEGTQRPYEPRHRDSAKEGNRKTATKNKREGYMLFEAPRALARHTKGYHLPEKNSLTSNLTKNPERITQQLLLTIKGWTAREHHRPKEITTSHAWVKRWHGKYQPAQYTRTTITPFTFLIPTRFVDGRQNQGFGQDTQTTSVVTLMSAMAPPHDNDTVLC